MDLFWLKHLSESWLERARQGRLPHAVLLNGPIGVGKRSAAAWMARQKLGLEPCGALPEYPPVTPEHADLQWLTPPEDKQAIGIEQVRELVANLGLTSYEGSGKVAVIDPANALTVNAANSLLKTLEEPPGDTLLILVTDRVGRLPATIFSRCQRLDFAPPPTAEAMAWLDQVHPGAAWADALHVAGGAPLAAITALDELETTAAMTRDLNELGQGTGSAIEIAARWAKLDPSFVLNWMAQFVRQVAVAALTGRGQGAGIDQSVLRRMDRRNLFCYLDIINRLRGQAGGSYNVQLTLEGLLIDWADGLEHCGPSAATEGMELMI